MKLVLHHFDLPLLHEFRISREAITTQSTLIVELQAGGERGFGESTTNAYYGATIDSMVSTLRRLQDTIEAHAPDSPEELWNRLVELAGDDSFSLNAVDQAAHDLAGKLAGQPLYRHWGLASQPRPVSNYTIGIDSVEKMVAKMQEMPGWPIYKIKLGTEYDLDIVRELRQHTDATFRVDANCGWEPEEAVRNSQALEALNVEFIEQPLAADDHEGHAYVFKHASLPIVADESCIRPSDVASCAGKFHGINIKLTKCGGLTPARRMIAEARQLGMKVMVGCMTESTVGISAIAHLLPLLDYVDMDGAALLARDIATGVRVENGTCHYADANGTGAQLKEDRIIDV